MAVHTEDEDYGDYVTRCICGFTHDDGYMICCDQCSVWQHVECMKVNPKNLPDKYLCEQCEPRLVDRKRARLVQMKKKEDISDMDEEDSSSERSHSVSRSGSGSPHPPSLKKKKKIAQRTSSGGTMRVHELKAEARRSKRDREDGKKSAKKKSKHHSPHRSSPNPILSGLQTLLTAASALEQQQADKSLLTQPNSLYNCTTSPWKDPYKTVDINMYTEHLRVELLRKLDQLKKEVVVYTREEYENIGSFPLCLVRDVGACRKGLVSEAHIPEDEMIMEYKSKITPKDVLCKELDIVNQLLWKQKPCPFVFQYDKISGLIVCLDSRQYGNTARFIRRSCNPNSELRHFFVNDDVHFGVYAINHISPEEEVTLPFDFPYEQCDYTVECACGQVTTCHVTSDTVKPKKTKKETMATTRTQLNTTTTQPDVQDAIPVVTPIRKGTAKGRSFHNLIDEDSNSSTGSMYRRRQTRVSSQSSNLSQQNSRDPTDSESEDLEGEIAKKRKSREERKTEAVWKMFEKMEASRRKKLSSLSDTSTLNELDTVTPSANSTPTVNNIPRHEIKERRLSGQSRNIQLLPSRKHSNLTSVTSSVDMLSPEHPDTFSPPLTPSVSSQPTGTQSDPLMSLVPTHAPFATIPTLSFEVTPYLHPKYLLADFALPRKKAILKQWEMEQREVLYDINESTSPWMTNGFALACIKAMEDGNRPRQRGCLKHRWMDKHSKEIQENELLLRLPQKKRLLQKWLETSSFEAQPTADPPNLTPPPSSSTSPSLTTLQPSSITMSSQDNSKPSTDHTPKTEVDSIQINPSSSLFDEFSDDDEFEDVSEPNEHKLIGGDGRSHRPHRQRRESKTAETTPSFCTETEKIDLNDSVEKSNANIDGVRIVSAGSATPPPPPLNAQSPVQTTSLDTKVSPMGQVGTNISSECGSGLPRLSPVKITVASEGETVLDKSSHDNKMDTFVEEVSGEEDDSKSVEMDISNSPLSTPMPDSSRVGVVRDDRTIADVMSNECTDKSLLLSPYGDGNKAGGAKRKMSLLEYRIRARKPSDQTPKKSSSQDVSQLASVMTTPTSTSFSSNVSATHSSHTSFLSYSSSFLSGSSSATRVPKSGDTSIVSPPPLSAAPITMASPLPLTMMSTVPTATTAVVASVGGNGSVTRLFDSVPSQFEPVSPDENNEIPPSRPSSLGSLMTAPPPPPPPLPSSNMPYNLPHTPTNILPAGGQQPMAAWGAHPPSISPMEDPRRAHQPPNPDMYIHRPLPPPTLQSPMSPQDLIRPRYPHLHGPPHPHHPPVQYNTMMHPSQQIRAPMGMPPHVAGGSGNNVYGQPSPRMPHPPILHQAPPPPHHHANNNYY